MTASADVEKHQRVDELDFLGRLDQAVSAKLDHIHQLAMQGEPGPAIGIKELLVTALKKELEASEEAAMWLATEEDVRVKLALARQCGDEAKHYRLIEERLRALGVDTSAIKPLAEGYSPMFHYLKGLTTTVERVAAGQFTREALAQVQNQLFLELCEARGDMDTARLYRDVIQPDEGYHHDTGRRLLARLATTEELQEKAMRAAQKTLEIAEEIQELVRLKKGICRAPGC